ncbi:MAG TPA: acetyl-CoA carboxylase carboxyltransferase subunit alpha [Ignavibacteria bacterium]
MSRNVLEFEKPIIELEQKIEEMRKLSDSLDISNEISKLEKKVNELRNSVYKNLTRWQIVQIARHPERPYSLDYIYLMTENFIELHGDRNFHDDKAVVGGFALLENKPVMIIGQQKGRDTKSNIYRNFGMMNPDGYRKALRLMRLAEKFNRPVITLIDTPGANPGMDAEERGQAEAIARNIQEMMKLKTPIIVCIIGEGASGGAFGIGVGDRTLMLEYCWYSVISPESCSSILFRSWEYKEQAAEALKLTAHDLMEHKIVDRIIPEPPGGAHRNHKEAADNLKDAILDELKALEKIDPDKFLDMRTKKYSAMGYWEG